LSTSRTIFFFVSRLPAVLSNSDVIFDFLAHIFVVY